MTNKTPEELAEALSFFPPGSVRMVNRILRRAMEAEARRVRKGLDPAHAIRGAGLGGSLAALATELTKAVRRRGATRREMPSVKQKAPETKGRSFHFAHSTVTKWDSSSTGDARGAAKANTKASAHMRYIEREPAVETASGVDRDPKANAVVPTRNRVAAEATSGSGWERDPAEEARLNALEGTDGLTSASAGQGYIENPVKLANGEALVFSFGNIGESVEERIAFWDKLEAAERKNGRVQNRLILELPHEASPEARFEIVDRFCQRFRDMGLPFWAALHRPGEGNDSRNFHAHIALSERRAKRIPHPTTGEDVWDFEVVERGVSACRHVREARPRMQKKHPFFRSITAIKTLREQFAQDANAVLEREAFRDKDGDIVLYDARSYAKMGLDTVPMKSVDRIVADKVRAGKLTILDKDYTKKMIRAELQEALARRDKGMMEVLRLEQALDALATEPLKPRAQNQALPKEMRVPALAPLTKQAVKTAATRVLDAKRAALSDDLMERSTRASLARIIEATDEKVVAASATNTRDPTRRAELPSEDAARLLNEAALEELRILDEETELRRKRSRYRSGLAPQGWRDVVAPRLPETSPIMTQAIKAAHEQTSVVRDPTPMARTRDLQHAATVAVQPPRRPLPAPGTPEFAARVREASAMTSAFIGQIASLPRDERFAVLDALVAKRNLGQAPAREPEAPAPVIVSAAAPSAAQHESAPQVSEPPTLPSSQDLVADQQRDVAEVKRKKRQRERQKSERRGVLAAQRRGDGRGR